MDRIVKIVRPINQVDAPLIVHDQGRHFVEYHDLTVRLKRQFAEDTTGYFKARRQEGRWIIGDRTEAQNW
jgi:hypothetical protein